MMVIAKVDNTYHIQVKYIYDSLIGLLVFNCKKEILPI